MKKIHYFIVYTAILMMSSCVKNASDANLISVQILTANQTQVRCTYHLEQADTPKKLYQGLMSRTKLDKNSGLYLKTSILSSGTKIAIWMKNTYIPLDILFVDQHGLIFDIHQNAQPLDETPIIPSKRPYSVIEINTGSVNSCNIQIGDIVRVQQK